MYILKAVWTESYDCPDNGEIEICETFEIINASNDMGKLQAIADDLSAGYGKNGRWNEERSKHLQKLYSGYDYFRNTEYVVCDLSDITI